MNRKNLAHLGVALCSLFSIVISAFSQGTAFTYQGWFYEGSNPATGRYDLTFALFTSSNGVNQVGGTLTNTATAISNGLFAVTLDFGPGVFTGDSLWLQIGAETNGAGSFSALTPRQQVTPAPYAIYAPTAGSAASANSVAASNLSGTIADGLLSTNVPLLNNSQTFTGQNTFNNNASVTGTLSVNSLAPASTLTVAGDVLMSGGARYHNLSLSGGNSTGFLYGSYPAFGDGIHLGYNYYADASGVGHVINAGGATSRISTGYGYIALLTGGVDSAPASGLTINTGSVNVTTTSAGVGINSSNPQATFDLTGDIIYRGITGVGGIWSTGCVVGGFGFWIPPSSQALAYIDTSGNYHQVSDLRLKRDIRNLDHALDRLLKLRPVSYHFHTAPANAPLSLGLLAQEVQPLFPEIVGEETNGAKDLVYSELIPVTIRSIQELNQKLETQAKQKDAKIAALEKQNAEMELELAEQNKTSLQMEARFDQLERALARVAGKPGAADAISRSITENK